MVDDRWSELQVPIFGHGVRGSLVQADCYGVDLVPLSISYIFWQNGDLLPKLE